MTIRVFFEFFAAVFGTIAFALLFQVPRKFYLACGLIGGAGWVMYSFMLQFFQASIATFFGVILVVVCARLTSFRMHCPATIFLTSGIFPLVPGGGVYWTAYHIVMEDMELAGRQGMETLKIAIAIALGILFVFELPKQWFQPAYMRKAE